jgi:hypothetical protein
MPISKVLRQNLAEMAQHQCGYCQTQEAVSGIPLTIEHLLPKSRGGTDDETNLWVSCRLCNEAKGSQSDVTDPQTGERVPLFNPRVHMWTEHFVWDEDGTRLLGQTSIGRATVAALSLNSEFRVRARAMWVEAGWHPPSHSP